MNEILVLNSLTKRFGRKVAVDNLSFEVAEGDLFGFLGPNGAGKTTTLSMLTGLIKPTSGSFSIFNVTYANLHKIKKQIGVLIETPAFYDYLSAENNLKIFARLHPNHFNIEELLEMVNLKEYMKMKVATFSHGMKQRLWLAQALLGNPKLLILDEPTNGLDPEGNRDIWQILNHLVREKKTTILISSHLLGEIEEWCNRVCIISEGKRIAYGSVSDLLQDLTHTIVIEIENCDEEKAENYFSSQKYLEIVDRKKSGDLSIYTINLKKGFPIAQINYQLNASGFSIRAFQLLRKTLREYFLEITASQREKDKNDEKK